MPLIKTLSQTLKQDKEKFKVPRSVQQAIPIRKIWPDGIFQKFLYILGKAGHKSGILTDTLVQAVEKVCTVFIAEQQIKLIRKDPCRFSLLPVLDHTVKNGIQCDQHSKWHQLFAQLPDVIIDDTALRIDIGFLGKGVQASVNKQFRRQCQPSGFFLRLEHELSVQIL